MVDRFERFHREGARLFEGFLGYIWMQAERLGHVGQRAALVDHFAGNQQQTELAHDHAEGLESVLLFEQAVEELLGQFGVLRAERIHQLEHVDGGGDDADGFHVFDADGVGVVDVGQQLGDFLRGLTGFLPGHFGQARRRLRLDLPALAFGFGDDPAGHFALAGQHEPLGFGLGPGFDGPLHQPVRGHVTFLDLVGVDQHQLGALRDGFEEGDELFVSLQPGILLGDVFEDDQPLRGQEGHRADGVGQFVFVGRARVEARGVHVRRGGVAEHHAEFVGLFAHGKLVVAVEKENVGGIRHREGLDGTRAT